MRLTKKLGVKTRAELFRYAFDVGMIGPDELTEQVPGAKSKLRADTVSSI